ncbi:hypothetical protein HT031_001210 [Scenedesmus sp. PABB004]|nr:hypothetical protein HT031_001210 [Scenedesmus sp. PABB004]
MSATQLQERGAGSREEVAAARAARSAARDALVARLASPGLSGEEKGWARCEYIHAYGRLPFQCGGCWLLPGFCICARMRRAAPASTKVVVHFHPDEWAKGARTRRMCARRRRRRRCTTSRDGGGAGGGSRRRSARARGAGSNTGSLCRSLAGAELLMRGHRPHDERLAELLNDGATVAMLWPGPDALEPEQLRALADERSGGRIVLLAIDATWDGARRMKGKYPPSVLTLRLPAHMVLPGAGERGAREGADGAAAGGGGGTGGAGRAPVSVKDVPPAGGASLFSPLRKYAGSAAERVCTAEAVASALLALEGPSPASSDMAQALLHNLKLKVNAMRAQKHMATVYDV